MLTLYDNNDSGNGYKVRLLLAWLGTDYHYVDLDIFGGASRTPEFLARNPIGRIPTLELDDGTHLAESGAILYYLAEDSPYWPQSRRDRADVLKWMFFEQYSHEPYIAVLRSWSRHGEITQQKRDQWGEREAKGYEALGIMEGRLEGHDFLVGDRPTIADIALFAYTHVADQGGYDLARFPAVQAWIDRIKGLRGHVSIDAVLKG